MKIDIIQISEEITSNGSTDSRHDRTITTTYVPTVEESNELLDTVQVNNRASLRDYLIAQKNDDQESLNKIKHQAQKPMPNNEQAGTETIEEPPSEGGVNFQKTFFISGLGWRLPKPGFDVTREAESLARKKGETETEYHELSHEAAPDMSIEESSRETSKD
ncbi:MAG: hypothetical protein HRT45_06775 [Bdellovibrionales bacterium]|nr:hypothetical protein [Bdellovibrionales bacterium]